MLEKTNNQAKIFLPLVNNFIYLSLAVKTRSICYKFYLFAFFHVIETVLLCEFILFKLLILRG